MAAVTAHLDLSKGLGAPGAPDHFHSLSGDDLSRTGRAARLLPEGTQAGQADEFLRSGSLYRRPAAKRLRHYSPARATLQKVFRANVRADHGYHLDSVWFSGGQ